MFYLNYVLFFLFCGLSRCEKVASVTLLFSLLKLQILLDFILSKFVRVHNKA